ncbi:MAG: hypothetical protein Roseis2KO_14380 [Roseivirga sp.]
MSQSQHELTVKITGIKKVTGKVGVCLISDPKEFLGNCSDYSEIPVSSQLLTFSKTGVRPGMYVITIYHDANSNGKLDTNILGIPKERYGFSNNPGSRFGPPGFKKCLFEIKSDTVINIRLR